jgi:hypothetical protein
MHTHFVIWDWPCFLGKANPFSLGITHDKVVGIMVSMLFNGLDFNYEYSHALRLEAHDALS